MISSIGSSAASLAGIGTAQRGEGAQKVARPGAAIEDRGAVSTSIGQLAGQGAPIELDRVAALKVAIRAGTYKPDPQAIARAMISGDLGSGL